RSARSGGVFLFLLLLFILLLILFLILLLLFLLLSVSREAAGRRVGVRGRLGLGRGLGAGAREREGWQRRPPRSAPIPWIPRLELRCRLTVFPAARQQSGGAVELPALDATVGSAERQGQAEQTCRADPSFGAHCA